MATNGHIWVLTAIIAFWGLLIINVVSLPADHTVRGSVQGNATDIFAYPAEQSAIESKQNARNRTPIFIPGGCAEDEILYPGDHNNDWVCDCKPTYIYHPKSHRCYQLYTQGSCEPGKIMYLEPNGKYPTCIPNHCPDGQIRFQNMCVVLNQEHKICQIAGINLVVGINEKTHQLECVNISDVRLNQTMITNHDQARQ
ncbi:uncharacterized protein LOC128273427 [Anopheles cruzii]|uniref:uncharacterized protein LOC128273427 n=1 Tax=Anopheles cruzii TaxID=68878 RepID=UPI0022EC499D|nr:uncharacterized protein LOC128273427 [Anopheles cruzii]XP_052867350.1 uncharacterized protein LOC128273427 [Anopheles cruzii]